MQVWAYQEGSTLHIGGKSNRARMGFKKELNDIMDMVPEVEGGGGDGEVGMAETVFETVV